MTTLRPLALAACAALLPIAALAQVPAAPAAAASAPRPSAPPDCPRLWREYEQSQACFNRYRVVGGGLKAEAFERCGQPLPDPAGVCGLRR